MGRPRKYPELEFTSDQKKKILSDTNNFNKNKIKVIKVQDPKKESVQIDLKKNQEKEEKNTKFNPQSYLNELFKEFSERENNTLIEMFTKIIEKIEKLETAIDSKINKGKTEFEN